MENIIKAIFITFLAVFGLLLNTNLSTQAHSLHYLKEDLEVAVHDATLELNESEISKGRIVFDQQKAKDTFKESFERNSGLTSNDYEVIETVFLDESTVSGFPTQYTAAHSGESATFTSPTLLVFVEAKRNAYFSNKSTGTFTQLASYSYKVKNPQTGTNFPDQVIGEPNEQGFVWPVPFTQRTTSPFGTRTHPISGEQSFHAGVDIADIGVNGTPAVAARAGTVIFVNPLSSYGNLVIIDHGGGVQTRYAHLSGFNTAVGDMVSEGQVIGFIGSTGGSTGPHLHFEIRIDGTPYDPMIFYR